MAADEKPNAGGRWRPLDWLQVAAAEKRMLADTGVAASGRGKCGNVSVGGCQAATCGHSSCCTWLQIAAGDKRTLAATCGHSSGCKWLPFPKSNYAPPACSMGILIINVLLLCHFQVLWGLEFFGGSVVAELHNAGSCTMC